MALNEMLLGALTGQSIAPLTFPLGTGSKKTARERAFTRGQVGKILDGTITTLVTETKVNGDDGAYSNVSALDASGAGGANPIVTVCNELAGVAENASGHWANYGVCHALVEADDTSIVIGRVLRLDLSTPEHCFVLDESGARSAGYGYTLEHIPSTTSGNKYLCKVGFSAFPFIPGTAS